MKYLITNGYKIHPLLEEYIVEMIESWKMNKKEVWEWMDYIVSLGEIKGKYLYLKLKLIKEIREPLFKIINKRN